MIKATRQRLGPRSHGCLGHDVNPPSVVRLSTCHEMLSLFEPHHPYIHSDPSLPPVLVSRFLLDLQQAHQQKIVCLSTNGPLDAASCDIGGDSAMFAPALGALSATISSADWGRDERQADGHAEDAHRNALTNALTKEGSPPVKEVVSKDGPSPNARCAPTAISLERHPTTTLAGVLGIDGPLGEAAAKS